VNDDLTPPDPIDPPRPRRGRRTALLVAASLGVLAALAIGIVVGTAGGGSDSPSVAHLGSGTTASDPSQDSSNGSGRQQALAYSRCMRDHGLADFPDPDSDGGLSIDANGPNSDLAPDNPQFQAADQACKHLLPNGGQPPPLDPELRAKTLAYSKCMRAHGIADFPDPNASGGLELKAGPGSDLAPDNPRFQAADKACKHLLPNNGKGGSVTQGRDAKGPR
jgi:hypothetical protein